MCPRLICGCFMAGRIASNLGRWTAATTLVLLASAAFAPRPAEASCGDYVMVGRRHAGHAPDADRLKPHAPAVPRCHGPMCSDNSTPPAAPTPKIGITIEHGANSGGTRLAVLDRSEVLIGDARVFPSDGFELSILRPPR